MNLLSGRIADNVPTVNAEVREGKLVFSRRGRIRFVVDTGFNGDMLIPEHLIKQLNLELKSHGTFELATGKIVTLPVYRGCIMIRKIIVEIEMSPGDALIGMSLMQMLGSRLLLDFTKCTVVLSG